MNINPWIGSKYEDGGLHNHKVLVLALSNYINDEYDSNQDYSNIIIENVNELVFEGKNPFFTKVSTLLLRTENQENYSRSEIEDKWNQIAFYNYIQYIFSGPRISPTKDMWECESNIKSFLSLVERISPNIILALGKDTSSKIPPVSKDITVIEIHHPSSAFQYETWVRKIQSVINE